MNWSSLLSSRRFGDRSEHIVHDKNRSRFEQDFDRIIFSQPFRKLQDKTQVFPLPEDDFVHTRLTHSLEVSSVGRSLGKNAGIHILEKYPELNETYTVHDFGSIVASASLAHDIGNPPFGHAGEDGISSFFLEDVFGQSLKEKMSLQEWQDLTKFEGNAQGFRMLNSPVYRGLELTFATLGAFTKYPLCSSAEKEVGRKSQKKYGYCQGDKALFETLANGMHLKPLSEGAWVRHPLAFLVEAADDICYGIIDLEDGCRLGLVSFDVYRDFLAAIIGDSYSEEKLNKISSMNEKLGVLRAMAITQLVQECSDKFIEVEEQLLNGTFDTALTDCIRSSQTLEKISALSVRDIYRARAVLEKEAGGYEVILKLMTAFCRAAHNHTFGRPTPRDKTIYRLLPAEIQQQLESDITVYQSMQFVTDFISSLTDRYAVRLYKIVYGL